MKRRQKTAFREDLLRADTYRLLGTLLAKPPAPELLQILSGAQTGALSAAQASAWDGLSRSVRQCTAEEIRSEFQNLFIGLGRGEVVPYASWYRERLLMGKPLAWIRQDLAQLGLRRRRGVSEPEDHAAALCETMAIIVGSKDRNLRQAQKSFFRKHLEPWLQQFFVDVQHAGSAAFYRAVGRLGEHFIKTERQYLTSATLSIEGGNHHETGMRKTSF